MGFPLIVASLLAVCILLQASPSCGSLSREFSEKRSVPTHCLQEAADCEIVSMAQTEGSVDVQMESQQDLQPTETMETIDSQPEDDMEQEEEEGEVVEDGGGEGKLTKVEEEGNGWKEGEAKLTMEEENMGGQKSEEKVTELEGKGSGGKKREEKKTEEDNGGDEGGEKEGSGGIKEGAEEGKGGGKEGKKRKADKAQNTEKAKQENVGEVDMEEEENEDPLPPFPSTIDGFGYAFNDKGQLRHKETGESFVFVVKEGDKRYNQAHYEALGEVITEHVFGLLESEAKLKRTIVPVDAKHGEPESFVFHSPDALSNEQKLMMIIHGSGVVRAGQWARRLIINDCLDSGTQLPFIQKAREASCDKIFQAFSLLWGVKGHIIVEGYSVLVLNTNRNHVTVEGKEIPIRGNASPEEHASYVWQHFIQESKAKEVYIVSHSYGGLVTTHLADVPSIRDSFQRKVKKIAFTDSVHNFASQHTSSSVKRWINSHAKNWVSCKDPLDTLQITPRGKVQEISAGTTKHEETSYFSMHSIFTYFRKKQ